LDIAKKETFEHLQTLSTIQSSIDATLTHWAAVKSDYGEFVSEITEDWFWKSVQMKIHVVFHAAELDYAGKSMNIVMIE
jgi:hypothetical protein